MRIALVAPPFISVPPKHYGGTELFVAHLARGLAKLGFEVAVYANGESEIEVEKHWLYEKGCWPIGGEVHDNLRDINHTAWAVRHAAENADIIHLNNAPGLAHSRFVPTPFVCTVHHPYERGLSDFYQFYPNVHYVTISDFQRRQEQMPRMRTIHHGIDLACYRLCERKQQYLSFLGRIAPVKGPHLAIEVAKKAGIPLKIAGEIQPLYRDYWETQIKPHVDGKFIEYIGEADLEIKNELLGNSLAMLFPIQWEEPFGLVMLESMATGTPVLAMPGGSVPEIVRDGISGYMCSNTREMASRVADSAKFNPRALRQFVQRFFSLERMVNNYARLYTEVLSGTAATETKLTDIIADGTLPALA